MTELDRRQDIRERWLAVGLEARTIRADEACDYWYNAWLSIVADPPNGWMVDAIFGTEQRATAYATGCQDVPWLLDLLEDKDARITAFEKAATEVISLYNQWGKQAQEKENSYAAEELEDCFADALQKLWHAIFYDGKKRVQSDADVRIKTRKLLDMLEATYGPELAVDVSDAEEQLRDAIQAREKEEEDARTACGAVP